MIILENGVPAMVGGVNCEADQEVMNELGSDDTLS